MSISESQRLRDGIRSGSIDCPDKGRHCNHQMAQHSRFCQWQWAIERIYLLEREDENKRFDTCDSLDI